MGSSDSRLSDSLASRHLSSPDALSGRVAFITGPTSGIGYESARVLAKYGCHVILGARDAKKTQIVKDRLIAEIKKERGESFEPLFTSVLLDLGSLESVRSAANDFLSKGLPLHYLLNNAGIMACPHTLNIDGFETQIATNHLGHYYLTKLLLPKIRETATHDFPARIINVSSIYHHRSPLKSADQIPSLFRVSKEKYHDFDFYAHSKLFNVLHANALAEQEEKNNILAFSLHPGAVATDLSRNNRTARFFYSFGHVFMKNSNEGASTQLYCAIAATKEESGKYFADNKVAKSSAAAKNVEYKNTLMQVSEQLINEWEEKHPIGAGIDSSSAANDDEQK